jgi:lipid-binding SYLF domain-containing protein
MRGLAFGASLILSASAMLADTAQKNLSDAAKVFDEVMSTPDKGIPQDLLSKAECIVIIPDMKKAAFVVGGEYGRGFAECRKGTSWGPPMAVRMEGGSVGFQIGGESTDLVMLVMNKNAMGKLLEDKFTLGGDASIAAGPVGRTAAAATNLRMDAEILSWSRSKGLFGGVSLKGATLRNDLSSNEELYGKKIHNKELYDSDTKPPAAADVLISALNQHGAASSADRSKQ